MLTGNNFLFGLHAFSLHSCQFVQHRQNIATLYCTIRVQKINSGTRDFLLIMPCSFVIDFARAGKFHRRQIIETSSLQVSEHINSLFGFVFIFSFPREPVPQGYNYIAIRDILMVLLINNNSFPVLAFIQLIVTYFLLHHLLLFLFRNFYSCNLHLCLPRPLNIKFDLY